jgi:hypothetical protein
VGKIPEDRDERLARLEAWADEQRSRLAEEERGRRYAEETARVEALARARAGQVDALRGVIPVVITKPSELPVDRAAVFADLMLDLREYPWADPIVSECDEARYTTPRAIDLARRHRPDAPWLLYMEDDVILGPHFGLLPELLREADELFPQTGIVSFFSGAFIEPGWSTLPMQRFGWLQCVAFRNTDYLGGFRSFIDDLVTQTAGEQSTSSTAGQEVPASERTRPDPPSDIAVGTFFTARYDAFALWCPSLVQHAELASVFGGAQLRRISRSYEQAYG